MPVTLNAYDGYDYRKKIVKKLYGATYGNVVSVLFVHHQASVTVAEDPHNLGVRVHEI